LPAEPHTKKTPQKLRYTSVNIMDMSLGLRT